MSETEPAPPRPRMTFWQIVFYFAGIGPVLGAALLLLFTIGYGVIDDIRDGAGLRLQNLVEVAPELTMFFAVFGFFVALIPAALTGLFAAIVLRRPRPVWRTVVIVALAGGLASIAASPFGLYKAMESEPLRWNLMLTILVVLGTIVSAILVWPLARKRAPDAQTPGASAAKPCVRSRRR